MAVQALQEAGPVAAAPSFWPSLNVFVTTFGLLAAVGGFAVVVPVSLVTKLFLPAPRAEAIAFPLAYAVLALGLAWYGWTKGLYPMHRRPDREARFRRGQVLLACCNVMAVAGWAASFALPSLAARGGLQAVGAVMLAMFSVAPFVGALGLGMVWTAGAGGAVAGDTEFVDTVAETAGRPPSAPRPAAAPSRAPTVAARAASSLPAIFGLLVSSLLIFMALVFAAISFQARQSAYTGVVLTIAAVCGLLYVTTVLWLLGQARTRAATWLAWSPALLMMGVVPALQILLTVFNMTTGRL